MNLTAQATPRHALLPQTHSAGVYLGAVTLTANGVASGQFPVVLVVEAGTTPALVSFPGLLSFNVMTGTTSIYGTVPTALCVSYSSRSLLFLTWFEWVNQMDVVVRTSGDPLLLASEIRREINRLDPSLAIGTLETVNQVLEKSLSAERFRLGC